jgi:hypothetical protein
MDRQGKDTNRNFWTLFFFSLLLLFLFASADRNGNEYSHSAGQARPYELVSGNISGHLNAVISTTSRIPEYQRFAVADLFGAGHNPCSGSDLLNGYNHNTSQRFTQVNMERLTIQRIHLIHTCFHAGSTGDDDVPVSA